MSLISLILLSLHCTGCWHRTSSRLGTQSALYQLPEQSLHQHQPPSQLFWTIWRRRFSGRRTVSFYSIFYSILYSMISHQVHTKVESQEPPAPLPDYRFKIKERMSMVIWALLISNTCSANSNTFIKREISSFIEKQQYSKKHENRRNTVNHKYSDKNVLDELKKQIIIPIINQTIRNTLLSENQITNPTLLANLITWNLVGEINTDINFFVTRLS